MFDRLCKRLCLHTRAARIVFISSLLFIMSVTVIAVVYLLEPKAMLAPQPVQDFDPAGLEQAFVAEFGTEVGERLFAAAAGQAEFGNNLLQEYVFLRRDGGGRSGALTAGQVRDQLTERRQEWQADGALLTGADNPYIRALGEDLDEAQELALEGLSRWTPFINQRLFRARGLFHDLHNVLLTSQSDDYFGNTRLGRLVETEGPL